MGEWLCAGQHEVRCDGRDAILGRRQVRRRGARPAARRTGAQVSVVWCGVVGGVVSLSRPGCWRCCCCWCCAATTARAGARETAAMAIMRLQRWCWCVWGRGTLAAGRSLTRTSRPFFLRSTRAARSPSFSSCSRQRSGGLDGFVAGTDCTDQRSGCWAASKARGTTGTQRTMIRGLCSVCWSVGGVEALAGAAAATADMFCVCSGGGGRGGGYPGSGAAAGGRGREHAMRCDAERVEGRLHDDLAQKSSNAVNRSAPASSSRLSVLCQRCQAF